MKKVAGTLKLAYSQFRELQAFSQFGSDLDADTKKRLEQGARIVEVLKQPQNSPIPVEKQVIIIYAVVSGALLDIPANQISEFEKEPVLLRGQRLQRHSGVHPHHRQAGGRCEGKADKGNRGMQE